MSHAAMGLCLAVCAAGASEADSQSAAKYPPVSDPDEVVIVTAQRRRERPHEVPISLTAKTGTQLDAMRITGMADLAKAVPSLVMTRTGAFTQPYLRGVGKRSTLGVDNAVATYVDGVYLASPIAALLDLRGIERIEVLNGPQGTLFGHNTPGGVIQVITKDPTSKPAFEASLQAGTDGHVRGDAYSAGGDERLAASQAVSFSRNDGYGENLYSGKAEQGEIDGSLVVRSKWTWRASQYAKLTLAGDYQNVRQDFSYRPAPGFQPIGAPRTLSFRDGDQDAAIEHRFTYGGVSLRADIDMGGLELTSISAVRRLHARYGNDLDQGPESLWSAVVLAKQTQFSQEFQLQSRGSSDSWWIAGLYYLYVKDQYDPTEFHYGGSYAQLFGGRLRQTLFAKGETSSYAAYGQASLPIGVSTQLAVGIRYTVEHRSVRASGEQLFDTAPFIRPIPGLPLLSEKPADKDLKFGQLSWRASIERQFSDRLMVYLSVSRGFQSGGWNLQTPQALSFGPEKLNDYEGGLKLIAGPAGLRANLSAFYYDYDDLQVSAFTALGSATSNATSAEVFGLGLEVDSEPMPDFTLSLGLQWLKTRFREFGNALCLDYSEDAAIPYAPTSCDVTGNRLPFAPRYRINVSTTQKISLNNAGALTVGGVFMYNSGYYSEADNVARQPSFATVDVSAEWRPLRSNLSVGFWALNVTDRQYYSSLAAVATAGVLQSPANPRRFGVSLGYRL